MGLIDLVGNALTSGGFGILSGLAGSAMNTYFKIKEKKLDVDILKLKGDQDLAMIKAESDAAVKVEEWKARGEIEKTEAGAFRDSIKLAMKPLFDKSYMQMLPKWVAAIVAFMFALMDVLRTSVRPVMTYGLAYVSMNIAFKVYQLDPELFKKEAGAIVASIAYLTTMALSWWFADRQYAKRMAKP